jgi:hypothetical protein
MNTKKRKKMTAVEPAMLRRASRSRRNIWRLGPSQISYARNMGMRTTERTRQAMTPPSFHERVTPAHCSPRMKQHAQPMARTTPPQSQRASWPSIARP